MALEGVKSKRHRIPISVPVGAATLGRIINVIGDPIDERGPIKTHERLPIHRSPQILFINLLLQKFW